MIRVKSQIISFFVAFGVWLCLCWDLAWATLAAGVAVSALIAVVNGHLFTSSPEKWGQFRRYWYFVIYLLVFLKECIKSNIDVALMVIQPNMPINPGIVKIKTRLKSEAALTFLANSITLTPGTLCVDIEKDEGVLYIHWINVKNKDIIKATEHISERFEKIIEKVFE